MQLDLRPMHPVFAAELRGLDLRETPAPPLASAIERAMDQYAVLVLRDQHLDDELQMAFGATLGPLEPMPAQVGMEKQRLANRAMVDISNLEVDGSVLPVDDRRRMFNLGDRIEGHT